jgi:hypothetical protein
MSSTSPYIQKSDLHEELRKYELRAKQDASTGRAQGMQIIASALRDRFDLPEPEANNG